MMNKMICVGALVLGVAGASLAETIFSATPSNTKLVHNNVRNKRGLTLAGAPGELILNNGNGPFNFGGLSSTAKINTLLGRPLAPTDTVTMKISVSGVTGEIRANGIYFGMVSGAGWNAVSQSPGSNLLIGAEASHGGGDIHIVNSSFQDVGNTHFFSRDAQIYNGFSITLIANKSGYTFVLDSIGKTPKITVEGSFAGTEFVDYFGNGHLYYGAQRFNMAAPLICTITEASIQVTQEK